VRTNRRSTWGRALRTPVGATAAALLIVVFLLAAFAPVLWSTQASAVDTSQILRGSSPAHRLGTDGLGRDILYRLLVGTRLSVTLALAATAIGVGTGLVLGTAPVWLGARLGRIVGAAVNIAVAFPGLLLALFFAAVFGVGATGAVLAIGLATAPGFARLTQTLVARVAGLDYIAAARIAGVGRGRVLIRHVLPNIGEPLVVNATIVAGNALLALAGLSFLGLGVQAPAYDWGRLLAESLNSIYINPSAAVGTGLAVVVAGLAFNLFGEAIARGLGLRTPSAALLSGRRRAPIGPAPAPAPGDGGVDASARGAVDREPPLLTVEGLWVSFPGPGGATTPVRGVGFTMRRGAAVGIVGESGSGKTLTALAIAGLIEEPGRVDAERLAFLGADLRGERVRAHRHLLGTSFAMVFQDPLASFNPTMRVGRQLAEVAEEHLGLRRAPARARAVDRLRSVRLPAAERRARQFPHELSGGMRQRAMIGMGLMGTPALIVADEPTTALDVTVQRQVLRLLESIRASEHVAILLISHDITVVSHVCERVLVMYAGRVVEDLPAADLPRARHPYTRALLAAVPDLATDRSRPLTVIPGRPVDPSEYPVGCAFAPRCPLADEHCRRVDPALVGDGHGRRVACWHADATPAQRAGIPT
jgi:peptide/nickel transport system permease protein